MVDSKLGHNFHFPTPLPLEELAPLEVALDVWRRVIHRHVNEDGTIKPGYHENKISLRCMIPEVTSTMLSKIEKYVDRFKEYIPDWLDYHSARNIFNSENVLYHFMDFVFDDDGTIHYGRTAKRFMLCNGISNEVKFKMACFYCLESDILRIWPEVSSLMTANLKKSPIIPVIGYWVFRLTNQLNEIALEGNTLFSEETVLQFIFSDEGKKDWGSIEYFLNRLPYNRRMKQIWKLELNYNPIFFKYILPKLSEAELENLVKEDIDVYVSVFAKWPTYVLHIWPLIKSGMSNNSFCEIVKYILKRQTRTDRESKEDDTSHWCELWTSAPDHLKQAAIQDVLHIVDSSYFDRSEVNSELFSGPCRSVTFLLAILTDTSIEDRRIFWNAHWDTLLLDIKLVDLRVLMNLCFDHEENQIMKFKKDAISEYNEKILLQLRALLRDGFIKELEETLTFWCPNEQSVKEVSVKLLDECFEHRLGFIPAASSLNHFIDNAYQDNNLAINFKKKMFSMPNKEILYSIERYVKLEEFCHIIEFVDIFITSDEARETIKHEIIDLLPSLPTFKSFGIRKDTSYFDHFHNFMKWLLVSDYDNGHYKETRYVEIMIMIVRSSKLQVCPNDAFDLLEYAYFVNPVDTVDTLQFFKPFLKRYFANPENVEKFIDDDEHYSGALPFKELLSALEEERTLKVNLCTKDGKLIDS